MTRSRVRLAILAAALPLSACGYGVIPSERDRAEAAWSDVQRQYQRRADLVPLLIAYVQSAAVEAPIDLAELQKARANVAGATATPDILTNIEAFRVYERAQANMDRALANVFETTRAHPQVQANQNVLTLQAQLQGPDRRVAVSRRDYNEAAGAYNGALRAFPTVFWAHTVHARFDPLPLLGLPSQTPAGDGRDVEIGSQ